MTIVKRLHVLAESREKRVGTFAKPKVSKIAVNRKLMSFLSFDNNNDNA